MCLICGLFQQPVKEQVPVEAVAAYVEAKHTLTLTGGSKGTLDYALQQAARVKVLCDQREAVPLTQITRNATLAGLAMAPTAYPGKRNPIYTAIIARHVRISSNENYSNDGPAIAQAMGGRGSVTNQAPPDLVVAGTCNVVLPSVIVPNGGQVINAPFMLPTDGKLASLTTPGLAFAIGLCHLLWALDYITLGSMPWTAILQDALQIPTTSLPGGAPTASG